MCSVIQATQGIQLKIQLSLISNEQWLYLDRRGGQEGLGLGRLHGGGGGRGRGGQGGKEGHGQVVQVLQGDDGDALDGCVDLKMTGTGNMI